MVRRLVVKEHKTKDRLIKEKNTNLLLPILCDMDAFRHEEEKEEKTVGLGLMRSGGERRGVLEQRV